MSVFNLKTFVFGFVIAASWFLITVKPVNAYPLAGNDSVIIAESKTGLAIGKNKTSDTAILKLDKEISFYSKNKYILCLKDVSLKHPPEGIYEIYITSNTINPAKLAPEGLFFVNVLNTYNLISSAKTQTIYIDISKNMAKLAIKNKLARKYTITLLFSGNRLANNSRATNAGSLFIKKILLLEAG